MAVHPTAILEPGVRVGRGTAIWDNVHIGHSTKIGHDCTVGEKTHIGHDVSIGDRVKIGAYVYICPSATVQTGAMIGAGTIFNSKRFSRAATPDLRYLRADDPGGCSVPTLVREGATIEAQCTIACALTIGRFAMIEMGSVVTENVPDFHRIAGNPARHIGYVCACGQPLTDGSCPACRMRYKIAGSTVALLA